MNPAGNGSLKRPAGYYSGMPIPRTASISVRGSVTRSSTESSIASPTPFSTPSSLRRSTTTSSHTSWTSASDAGPSKHMGRRRHASQPAPRPAKTDVPDTGMPPWDRSVDIHWERCHRIRDEKDFDNELAFQENCIRLSTENARLLTLKRAQSLHGSRHQRPGLFSNNRVARGKAAVPGMDALVLRRGNGCSAYFRLPDRVRFIVCQYVLSEATDHDDRPIRMNSPCFYDPIWPINKPDADTWTVEYLVPLAKVLQSLEPCLTACSAMRVDMLVTLFLTRQFHVVYSPYVGPRLQPAATSFMDKFGPLMSRVILEVDFTKQAGGWHGEAAGLDMAKTMAPVRRLLEGFVARQRTRTGGTYLDELTILVRRYAGCRPAKDSGGLNTTKLAEMDEAGKAMDIRKGSQRSRADPAGYQKAPTTNTIGGPLYCDDVHLQALDPLQQLEGFVIGATIVGASLPYTKKLILALWGEDCPSPSDVATKMMDYCHHRSPSRAFPDTPGQSSVLDYGPTLGIIEKRHLVDAGTWTGLYGCRLNGDVAAMQTPVVLGTPGIDSTHAPGRMQSTETDSNGPPGILSTRATPKERTKWFKTSPSRVPVPSKKLQQQLQQQNAADSPKRHSRLPLASALALFGGEHQHNEKCYGGLAKLFGKGGKEVAGVFRRASQRMSRHG